MGLFSLPEHEVDKIINRVLTNQRVEAIADRLADKLIDRVVRDVLGHLAAGIEAQKDK